MAKQRYSRLHYLLVDELVKVRGERSKRQASATLGRPNNFVHYVESMERMLDSAELIEYVDGLGGNPGEVVTNVHRAWVRERRRAK